MADFKSSQEPYVKVLRKKLGEFMLVVQDMNTRGVEAHNTLTVIKNKNDAEKIINEEADKATSDWAEDIEINTLCRLLYNNGYPFQMHNKIAQEEAATQIYPPNNYFDGDALYKSYFIFGDLQGEAEGNQNHYTLEFPNNLLGRADLPEKIDVIGGGGDTQKVKIPGDGHCFYRAMAVWCMIYGVTPQHLDNLSYNIPFDFNKDAHLRNFKVDTTGYVSGTGNPTENKIPKPIYLIDNYFEEYTKKALDIARNFQSKMMDLGDSISYEETQIINSEAYKAYKRDGVTQNNGTHCKKYTGNGPPKVLKLE